MTRTLRFPWYAALPPLALLGLLGALVVNDARAQSVARQAKALQSEFQFDAAHALRREAAQRNPRDAQLQLALGQSARTLWNFRDTPELRQEADAAFDRAARLSPHWAVPHYEHARMYAFKEQYARALSLLAPALKLDPNNAGYWLERARSLEGLNRGEEARAAYARCWAIDTVQDCEVALRRLGGQP